MSIEAMLWAKRQRLKPLGGTVAHRAILLTLADYADEGGECFPGQVLIAWETEQSERTVRRHLGDLEGWGLFRREARFRIDERTGRQVRTSDRFVLALSADLTDAAEVSTGQPDRRPRMTGGQVDRRPDDAFVPDNTPSVVPDTVDRVSDRGTDREEPTDNSSAPEAVTPVRPTKRTRVPEPFTISERCKAWAAEKYPAIDPRQFVAETEHFVGWHTARASTFADWDHAWMNWMRRAAERMTRPSATARVDTGYEQDADVKAQQAAMFEGRTGT